MLVWLTLPYYDFCGFRSVAVNSVYKLQLFLHLRHNSEMDATDFTSIYIVVVHNKLINDNQDSWLMSPVPNSTGWR